MSSVLLMEIINVERDLVVDGIAIKMQQIWSDVKLFTSHGNYLCANQTIETVEPYIKQNYETVSNYFFAKISGKISFHKDLMKHCFMRIVLHYIYLYSSWNKTYVKSHYELLFHEEDLNGVTTFDLMILTLRKESIHNWQELCALLMDKDMPTFKEFLQRREGYFNR